MIDDEHAVVDERARHRPDRLERHCPSAAVEVVEGIGDRGE
jgi:hypothetical protein